MTPEEVVFRTNSDQPSIVFVLMDRLVYAEKGVYGGYLLRGENLSADAVNQLLQQARAFYVEPSVVPRSFGELPEELKRVVKQYVERLPEELKSISDYTRIEVITYRYVEVEPRLKSVRERYVVIDFEPKPGGLKLSARAMRVWLREWSGSRRRPRGHAAREALKELRLKYPENEVLQRYVYALTCLRDCRDSAIVLKIVVEAPRELVPTPAVAAATAQQPQQQQEQKTPVLVNGFLVISRLPSKALLDAHLPEIFKDVKIGTKQIKLVMGYFYNKLGTLSRKFYTQILPKHAIYAGFGYIVPKSKVAEFLRDVDLLKREYEEYERQLKRFLTTGEVPPEVAANKRAKVYREYLEIVREYLRRHGAEERIRKKIEELKIADRVQIRLLPFAVDPSIIYEYADEKVRRRIEEELESFRREIAEAVRQRIREYMQKIMEKLKTYAVVEARKELLERARKDLERFEKEARELGVELPELERLREMLSEEKVRELAVEAAKGRVKALMEF